MTPSATPDPNLSWLLDTLWGSSSTPMSPGATYRVIPGARRARMLVPENAAVAAVALRAGGGTRSPRAQRARSGAAALVRLGVFRDRVRAPADDPLHATIREALQIEEIALACAIRRPSPFRKPVLQVLTRDGRVVAYAKVAWNEVTAANVTAEHLALVALRGSDRVAAPVPLALVSHRGFPMLLTEPMPEGLRRYEGAGPPADPSVSRTVSRVLAARPVPDPIGARLGERFAATAATDLGSVRVATAGLLDAIGSRTGMLEAGAWHGDWSPWNLGWADGRLWAWDWEYCRADVPVGLDVPHFHFQRRFIAGRMPVDRAFRESSEAAGPLLASFGYDEPMRATVHAVHVAEVTLRYLEASSRGIDPNPRFVAGAEPAIHQAIDRLR